MLKEILNIELDKNEQTSDWLRYIAEGRLEEAYQISSSTNVFPEVCGRVCPQDRLCEGNCVVEQAGFGAITIGNLEKYLTEVAFEKGWVKNLQPNNSLKTKNCYYWFRSCWYGSIILSSAKWLSS